MARKKIIFVIVEGKTDYIALGVILAKLYNKDFVYVEVIEGDITSDYKVSTDNIVAKLGDIISIYAKRKKFKKSDFLQVIHLVDTDGVYIPNTAVVDNPSAISPLYSLVDIQTCNRKAILNRNSHKRKNLNRIIDLKFVWVNIPYRVYYMSSNLDHVLYNTLNSTTKEVDAYKFSKKYSDDLDGFLTFISKSDFSKVDDYKESWNFIKEGTHSLERYSNLGICFSDIHKSHII